MARIQSLAVLVLSLLLALVPICSAAQLAELGGDSITAGLDADLEQEDSELELASATRDLLSRGGTVRRPTCGRKGQRPCRGVHIIPTLSGDLRPLPLRALRV